MTEKNLFNYMKEEHFPDLVMSRGKMSRWDCYSPEYRYRLELKCRRKHYETLLLERSKFEAMVKECRRHSDVPLYVNSTPKGIYAFDLSLIEPEWTTKKLPATTQWGGSWVDKEVTMLCIKDSKVLKIFPKSLDI